MSFTHLHAASGYSLRYGASSPYVLAERAAERGLDALALTDRDSLAGAVRFAKACERSGVRPLFGADLAVPGIRDIQSTPGAPATPVSAPLTPPTTPAHATPATPATPAGERQRTPARGGAFVAEPPFRAVVLARSAPGWAELCRLVSAAAAGGIRWEDLTGSDGGLFVLLGAESEVGQALAAGRPDRAALLLEPWRERFGDALRLEVACHGRPGTGPGSLRLAARMAGFAAERQVTAVLSNSVRYADPGQRELADILDSARLLVPIDTRDAARLDNGQRWLKDAGEMERIAGQIAEAMGGRGAEARELVKATEETAAACLVDPGEAFGLGRLNLPEPRLVGADGGGAGSADRVLAERCAAGMMTRGYHRDAKRWDRLEEELGIIAGHGFAGYFLTVAQVAAEARRLGVRVAARGSGVGSLATHLLDISPVDPLEHGLLMERFLSAQRSALPDIDLDVESARRIEVYQAVREKFGDARVATLAVYKTYRVRGAIEDVARARGVDPRTAQRLATAFPHIRARDARTALAELPELREVAGEDHGRLWELVEALDGLPFEAAMHPCGLLVSNSGLLSRTPVAPTTVEGIGMAQFDKEDVEDTGHPKIDIIGVRMQSALAHAAAEIERATGERIDLDDPAQVPPDDAATYDMIGTGDTLGTFQLESPGQRELVRNLRPRSFLDLIIDISLFRPGPVAANMVSPLIEARDGRTRPHYPHPDLKPVLEETEGQVVFHEQVIGIMAVMTGCDRGVADEARRALSDPVRRGRLRVWFADQARARDYQAQVIREVWEVLESFGSFGFAKAHAAAFAHVAYQSSWLRTHRMAALLAGLLTHDPGMYHKRVLVADARRHGVPVLLPDINRSQSADIIELVSSKWGVRVGLSHVRGITAAETERITSGQPYASPGDFWERARPSRPLAERLAQAGALDDFGPRRELLLQVRELHRSSRARGLASGQLPIDTAADTPAPGGPAARLPAMGSAEQLAAELDILGMDVSRHLLEDHRALLADIGATPAADLPQLPHGTSVLVAGVKVATQTPPIRSGKRVIFATLDDPSGLSDLAFFEDSHARCAHTVFHSGLLLVRGTVARRPPRATSITGVAAWDLAELIELHREGGPAAVADRLTRPAAAADPATVQRTITQSTGYELHPWADLKPPGSPSLPGRTFHHASPGSAG